MGVTLWFGPGYALHISTEDGFQFERAPHRTWRLGILFALRRPAELIRISGLADPERNGIYRREDACD